MYYLKLQNGNPVEYTIAQLKADNPKVSFPAKIPDTILAQYNVYPVTKENPTYNKSTHKIDSWYYEEVANNWYLKPTIRAMTAEELTQKGKRDAENTISDSMIDAPAIMVELIDKLIEKGIVSRTDFTPKSLQTLDGLKAAATKLNS